MRCTRCQEVTWLPLQPSSPVLPQGAVLELATNDRLYVATQRSVVDGTPTAHEPKDVDDMLRRALEPMRAPPEMAMLQRELLRLTSQWDDYDGHRTLLQRARAEDGLPWLAGCYRAVLAVKPEDPMALRAQQDIVALALASLPQTHPPTTQLTSGVTRTAIYGMLLLGVIALIGRFLYQTLRYL
ncbi:MAG: hypothetical protein ACO3JL_02080 [Myxococcota bacterium]